MDAKIGTLLLLVCIAVNANEPAPQDQPAQSGGQAAPAPKKSELDNAKDQFVGGVAAIGDSAARAGQAVVDKVKGVRDSMEQAGSKIVQTWSQAGKNTKDIVQNIGNTDNAAKKQ